RGRLAPRRPGPGHARRAPGRRGMTRRPMNRPALWRLPPWRRAPLLALRSPAAVVAVLVTSAVLACALASAPLFLSSARSAALQGQLAPQCAEAAWPQIGSFTSVGSDTPADLAEYAHGFE